MILLGALAMVSPDSLRRNNAVKSAISLVVATVTVIAFGIFGPVDWLAVALIAPAALLGGVLGAKVARRIPEGALRWTVIVLSLGVGVYLAVRAIQGG